MELKKIKELEKEICQLGRFYGTFEEKDKKKTELDLIYSNKDITKTNEVYICKTKNIENIIESCDFFRELTLDHIDGIYDQNETCYKQHAELFKTINDYLPNFQEKNSEKNLEFYLETPKNLKIGAQTILSINYENLTFPILDSKFNFNWYNYVLHIDKAKENIEYNLEYISKILNN